MAKDRTAYRLTLTCTCLPTATAVRYGNRLPQLVTAVRSWVDQGCHENPGHRYTLRLDTLVYRRSSDAEAQLEQLLRQPSRPLLSDRDRQVLAERRDRLRRRPPA
jgi:hypothetical protein